MAPFKLGELRPGRFVPPALELMATADSFDHAPSTPGSAAPGASIRPTHVFNPDRPLPGEGELRAAGWTSLEIMLAQDAEMEHNAFLTEQREALAREQAAHRQEMDDVMANHRAEMQKLITDLTMRHQAPANRLIPSQLVARGGGDDSGGTSLSGATPAPLVNGWLDGSTGSQSFASMPNNPMAAMMMNPALMQQMMLQQQQLYMMQQSASAPWANPLASSGPLSGPGGFRPALPAGTPGWPAQGMQPMQSPIPYPPPQGLSPSPSR